MFSRSAAIPETNPMGRLNGALPPAPLASAAAVPPAAGSAAMSSLLGQDIKITGTDLRISSVGTLRIDGDVQGEVYGGAVVIGEGGTVTGQIFAKEVVVRGHVLGIVRAAKVVLQSSARMEGDIHNNAIVVEPGARFDGRCHRLETAFELAMPT